MRCLANRVLGTLSVACAACLLAPGAALAGTLDQQQTVGASSAGIHSTVSIAQTFTAGLSGGVDQVDLSLLKAGSPTAALTVELRDASAGMPGSTVLASQIVPEASVPVAAAFVSINFPTPASVVAGTQYAIVAYSAAISPNNYGWGRSTANPYAGGESHFTLNSPPSGPWNPIPSDDQVFKTYVVVPTTTVTTPSNAFTIGELDGTTLKLDVPSAGVVGVSDAGAQAAGSRATAAAKKLLKTSSATGGPGTIEVTLKLTKLAKQKLREKGNVKVNARITFTPNGGTASSQTQRLKIKK